TGSRGEGGTFRPHFRYSLRRDNGGHAWARRRPPPDDRRRGRRAEGCGGSGPRLSLSSLLGGPQRDALSWTHPPAKATWAGVLEGFREYLRLLGRLQLNAHLAGKIDLSGAVQQTLLEAYQGRDDFPSDAVRQAAWLRRALANNLVDEIRRLGPRGQERMREL